MEDIVAEKVIAAWLQVGLAAAQDAMDFLPEQPRCKLQDLESCLKPVQDWPQSRRVESEWVVKAA